MAFSPKSQLVYIPVSELGMTVRDAGGDAKSWHAPTDRSADASAHIELITDNQSGGTGKLVAWNPVTQQSVWQAPQPGLVNGGVLATAGGLVFQGNMAGAFNAYDDMTGKLLWTFGQDAPVIAPPITYFVNGKQYVSVLTGLGSSFGVYGPAIAQFHIDPRSQARRVLTFSLDAHASLPPAHAAPAIPADPSFEPDPTSANAGAAVYGQHCIYCHGMSAVSAGHPPDLRRSTVPLSDVALDTVVRKCTLVAGGMPCFPELTDRELYDVRQYLRTEMQTSRLPTAR